MNKPIASYAFLKPRSTGYWSVYKLDGTLLQVVETKQIGESVIGILNMAYLDGLGRTFSVLNERRSNYLEKHGVQQ